jgi:predicted enzyme related to lactoylglutathione lyase
MLQPDVPAWFEIPVTDIERAQSFYEALLGVTMKRSRYMGETDQAVFPNGGPDHASGALVQAAAARAPSQRSGTIVYLSVRDIRPLLERVTALGGEVLLPLTAITDSPVIVGHIRDSEGNRVGLASIETAA